MASYSEKFFHEYCIQALKPNWQQEEAKRLQYERERERKVVEEKQRLETEKLQEEERRQRESEAARIGQKQREAREAFFVAVNGIVFYLFSLNRTYGYSAQFRVPLEQLRNPITPELT